MVLTYHQGSIPLQHRVKVYQGLGVEGSCQDPHWGAGAAHGRMTCPWHLPCALRVSGTKSGPKTGWGYRSQKSRTAPRCLEKGEEEGLDGGRGEGKVNESGARLAPPAVHNAGNTVPGRTSVYR